MANDVLLHDRGRTKDQGAGMSHSVELFSECKKRLLSMRSELLNRSRELQVEFSSSERLSGDEADLTVALLEENSFVANHSRIRNLLLEIDFALDRIECGQYGVCEETLEPIEPERLLAIPYTRLSIEGAELRDALKKRRAR